jgi:hypothetical protein
MRSASRCIVCKSLSAVFLHYQGWKSLDIYPVWLKGERNILADATTRLEKLHTVRDLYPETVLHDEYSTKDLEFWWKAAEQEMVKLNNINPGGFDAMRRKAKRQRAASADKCIASSTPKKRFLM